MSQKGGPSPPPLCTPTYCLVCTLWSLFSSSPSAYSVGRVFFNSNRQTNWKKYQYHWIKPETYTSIFLLRSSYLTDQPATPAAAVASEAARTYGSHYLNLNKDDDDNNDNDKNDNDDVTDNDDKTDIMTNDLITRCCASLAHNLLKRPSRRQLFSSSSFSSTTFLIFIAMVRWRSSNPTEFLMAHAVPVLHPTFSPHPTPRKKIFCR